MKRKRKRTQKKQSLTKNVALLFLSIGLLAGASVLFSTISARHSYDPIESKINKLVSKAPEKNTVKSENTKPQKSSVNSFEYSYWDILLLQDRSNSPSGESYSVQIAAFRSQDAAKKFADDLEGKTHLKCAVEEKGKLFIVRWGTFHTREVAQRYSSTLSGRLQKECSVVRM